MKIAVMQPYFFPYVGYFQLMTKVDHFLLFDQIQFINKGWINRNRILHADPLKEFNYITVPLSKRHQFDKISDIAIYENTDWKKKIINKLSCYKKKAPYYDVTIDFIKYCFEVENSNLSIFLFEIMNRLSNYLDIKTEIKLQSKMNIKIDKIKHPGQWALEISKALGAAEYINLEGGYDLYKHNEFNEENIKLSFLKVNLESYNQKRKIFVPGLSIIDILMWNSLSECKNFLSQGQIFSKKI